MRKYDLNIKVNFINKKLFNRFNNDYNLERLMHGLVKLEYGEDFDNYELLSNVDYLKDEYIKFSISLED